MNIKITNSSYKSKPIGLFGIITKELKAVEPREINFVELAKYIRQGKSFILANYKTGAKDITRDLIQDIPAIALDIDDTGIKMNELISDIKNKFDIFPIISYRTFSDINGTRFRLIYQFEQPIQGQEWEIVFKAFNEVYGQYLDKQCSNYNRVWAGTNKTVYYMKADNFISEEKKEIIKGYAPKETTEEKKYTKKEIEPINFNNEILNRVYIKSEYKDQICETICKNICIKDFIIDNFGGNFKQSGDKFIGQCSLHGGDNKNALVIYTTTNTYRCYTHCGSGNVLTLAYKLYKTNDFTSVVLQLLDHYGISIPSEAIGVKAERGAI